MKIIQLIGIGLGMTFFATPAVAQDDDEPKMFSYATYFYCSANGQSRADEIIERGAPLMDELVDNGVISAWGWLSHVIGGRFRRLQTMTASDLSALVQARGDAIAAIFADDSEAGAELSDICGPHVDYIWNIVHEKP